MLEDSEVIESSQDDEIELQIPGHGTSSLPSTPRPLGYGAETAPISPSDGSYYSPRGYTFPESTYPDEFSYQSQPHSYDGDVEPASPSLQQNIKFSTAQILKDMKQDWKKTCQEFDIPYESQATFAESLDVEFDVNHDKTNEELESESQSMASLKNANSTQPDSVPSSSSLSQTPALATSLSSIPTVIPHRAARRARRAAHNVATLQNLLFQEQRRYRRLLAMAHGKKNKLL